MKINKFSIIIPVYNSEKFIADCLTSIINQTYKDIEIVLINDGSNDNSLKIMQAFANEDSRIRIVEQGNAGASAARNIGLSLSTGEYIIFIDSDDYLMDVQAIEKLSKSADRGGDVLIYNILYENKSKDYPLPEKLYRHKSDFDTLLFHLVKFEHLNSPCNKVYTRKIIDINNIRFNDNLKIGEDLLFNIEYFKHCHSAYYLNDTLYFYRTSNIHSITSGYMETKYADLMTANDAMTSWLTSRNNQRLTSISHYIRIKNILSCLRDITHPMSTLNSETRQKIITRYKVDNPHIIVKNCGIKIYAVSLVYSLLDIDLLSRVINKVYKEKK